MAHLIKDAYSTPTSYCISYLVRPFGLNPQFAFPNHPSLLDTTALHAPYMIRKSGCSAGMLIAYSGFTYGNGVKPLSYKTAGITSTSVSGMRGSLVLAPKSIARGWTTSPAIVSEEAEVRCENETSGPSAWGWSSTESRDEFPPSTKLRVTILE